MILNFLLILLLCTGLILIAIYQFRNENTIIEHAGELTIDSLITAVDEVFEDILSKDFRDLNLNQTETDKRENIRKLIRRNLKECTVGDENAKEYIKDYMEEIIRAIEGLNENTINNIIPFDIPSRLKPQDKFEILLYIYKERYGKEGFHKLTQNYNLDVLKENGEESYYAITREEVERVYYEEGIYLSSEDKIKILTQRVYQQYRGFGVIDAIREMKIDGISGGVSSGILSEKAENSLDGFYEATYFTGDKNIPADKSLLDIWVFYQGRTIRLEFLRFPSEKELIRVCRNIYRNNNPGLLSETRGYMVNDMKDGSRVVVFRPPVAAGWAFFVRKHDVITSMDIKGIITEEGGDMVISLLRWMVKGCLSLVITGEMGSGKTTLLKILVQYIEEIYPIRVYEQVYELNLNKAYPQRNILSLRESPAVSGQEILNTMKKTDGTVLILGEVASHDAANYLVEISQISKMTLCSHHAETTEDFVAYLKIAQLRAGGFHNEGLAEYQAAGAVSIDIHMENRNGHRYISRITEIVPYYRRELPQSLVEATREYYRRRTSPVTYETREIIAYQDGKYVYHQGFSPNTAKHIGDNLTGKDREEFLYFLKQKKEVHHE
ncbi:pilus assembly protein CpaF [Anaerocolumna jejuensis DSM 15929]|uniref:Pilus assembly protein CpaF n=1 Tax=Anaerocolumna jejuensis DSM 15929 TaxID=1121322 RepID=A0A1M6M6H7_9FIRM|nr:ATPase, T2SS/T4P/T4SS family [Anaerocolumna jejuensis]SHJ79062.1 pilus assembly protein CpaF [Anaerocolumna jejuensis DSM 15929]